MLGILKRHTLNADAIPMQFLYHRMETAQDQGFLEYLCNLPKHLPAQTNPRFGKMVNISVNLPAEKSSQVHSFLRVFVHDICDADRWYDLE